MVHYARCRNERRGGGEGRGEFFIWHVDCDVGILLSLATDFSCFFWGFFGTVSSPQKFGIVVDAGSTHSDMYVFTWRGDMPLGTADVELLHQCFLSGGVNSLAVHGKDIASYFGSCIAEVENYVPKSHRPYTPLYVRATAGMRILKTFDPERAKAVLSLIKDYFNTSTTFKVEHNSVEILPSTEEGLSGWIVVNYLINHLKQVLYMDLIETCTCLFTFYLFPYRVHSQSFLCYGIAQARLRHNFLLLKETGANVKQVGAVSPNATIDPCLAKGTSYDVLASDLNGPCTLTDHSKPLLSAIMNVNHKKLKMIFKNYQRNNDKTISHTEKVALTKDDKNIKVSSSFKFQGSSDASKCEEKIRRLFNHQLCKETFTYGDCMGAHSVPSVNHTIIAFSGLFDHLMVLLDVSTNFTFNQYKEKVHGVCSLEANTLNAAYPGLKEVVDDLCFDAMFIFTVLTTGLGIDNSSWGNVYFSDELNKRAVVWPHGFMLNQTSNFVPETTSHPLTLATFTLLVLLFLAFVTSGILFLRHTLKIKRHSASYQRVIADHIDHQLHTFI
nr:ectonucleoside triphosphate diphosphohydrolase 1-like [Cherax quadricarinatus]